MWRVLIVSVVAGTILVIVSLATCIVYVHEPPPPGWTGPVCYGGCILIIWPMIYGVYAICATTGQVLPWPVAMLAHDLWRVRHLRGGVPVVASGLRAATRCKDTTNALARLHGMTGSRKISVITPSGHYPASVLGTQMAESEQPAAEGKGKGRPHIPLHTAVRIAQSLAPFLAQLENESPALFERLGGTRRVHADLDNLIADLRQALEDRDPQVRLAAVGILRFFGRVGPVDPSHVSATWGAAAAAVLSVALVDTDATVREKTLVTLAMFAAVASPTLVNQVSQATEAPSPQVRQAAIATLRAFGPRFPLPVVAALLRVMTAPGAQDAVLVQMAVEGLQDCGQDAASEAVDTLAVTVRDSRLASGVRVAACQVLGWLGPDATSAFGVLLDTMVGGKGVLPGPEVQAAAAKALLHSADLPALIATRSLFQAEQHEVLSILRQIGPDATAARRAIQTAWQHGQPPSPTTTEQPATDQPTTAQPDLTMDRLAAFESKLDRIDRHLQAVPAGSADKAWYTVEEVAALIQKSPWTVRQACNKGRIAAQKSPDDKWRISKEEVTKIQNYGLPK